MTRIAAVAMCLLAVSGAAAAQPAQPGAPAPPLVTDRPGFGESSEVVGRGVLQFESGFTLAQIDADQRQVTVPELLVRLGITRRIELRIASDGYVALGDASPAGRIWTHGHADLDLGGKIKLLDAVHGVDLALIPFLSLPTASPGFSTARYDPGFKIAIAHGLPWGLGMSETINTANATSDSGRVWSEEISVSVDHGLGGSISAFGEVDGDLHDAGCDCSIDGGMTVAVGNDRQLDAWVGRRVGGAAQDWFIGVGFSLRHRRR